MRAIIFVVVVCAAVAVITAKPAEEKYTTKYDNIDIDEILSNKRLLKAYVNCLLGKGGCTPDAAELKRVLPDALETECSKCNDKQKEGTKKVFKHLIEQEKGVWEELEKVYDPKGDYKKKYCAKAKEEGIDTKGKCDE